MTATAGCTGACPQSIGGASPVTHPPQRAAGRAGDGRPGSPLVLVGGRHRGVPRRHRPVAAALGRRAPATASDAPSVEPAPTPAASARPWPRPPNRSRPDRNGVVGSPGRLPRRPDRRARGGRPRLVLVGRPRVRLAVDRPAHGLAAGPGATPRVRFGGRPPVAAWTARWAKVRNGEAGTPRLAGSGAGAAARDRCAAGRRRLEPAGRVRLRRRRAGGVVLARAGRSVTRRVSPPVGVELAVGRPRAGRLRRGPAPRSR